MTADYRIPIQLSRLARVAAVVASLAFSLFVLELAIRWVLPPPGFYALDRDEAIGLKVPDTRTGFRYAANFSGRRVTRDYDTEVTTNAWGFRDTPLDDLPSATLRILAVGDSFTDGLGVEYAEAWPAQLEQLIASNPRASAPVRVINAGVSAYNLRQIRLTMEELVPVITPAIVIVGVFVEGADRIERPFVYLNGITVRSDDLRRLKTLPDGLLYSPFDSQLAIRIDWWLSEHLYTAAYMVKAFESAWSRLRRAGGVDRAVPTWNEAQTKLAPLLDEIARMQRLADYHGQNLLVLLANQQMPNGEFSSNARLFNRIIKEHCRANGILNVVDPLEKLEQAAEGKPVFRFTHDGHWTAGAHSIAAQALYDSLIANGLLFGEAVESLDAQGVSQIRPGEIP